MHLADSLPARVLALPVLAFEAQETELRLLRQIRDAQLRLQQTSPRVDDGLRERSDVPSGFDSLRGGEPKKKKGQRFSK